MQEENVNLLQNGSHGELETVSASFRNLSIKEPIKNSVIYFWESHTKNPEDKKRTQATIDLIYKKFDVKSCEKYEVRTGYLSRYNYLSKPKKEATICELEAAIEKGEEEQSEWVKRCDPKLPGFIQKNWQECVNKEKNPHFVKCRELLTDSIKNDDEFETAFSESVSNFISKRSVNAINSKFYLIEENAWILTLPLLHPNKQIYIIHVGNVTESTLILFSRFSYLRDSARLLLPTLCNERFNCMSDFLMDYKNKKKYGYSHPVDDEKIMNFISTSNEQPTESDLLKMFLDERSEKELLSSIISKMPGHVYWISKDGIYLGCNDLQAQRLGLGSGEDIVGKTNYNLLPEKEARKHNNINKMVMERGISYSGEETSTMQGGKHSYLSYKVPLFNSSRTKVVGLLGMSMDITDRKRAEKLVIQNKIQKKFQKVANQVVHDIRTPLQVLLNVSRSCKNLSEKEHVMLRDSVDSIKNIAQEFLEYSFDKKESFEYQHILVSQTLKEVLDQKKRQYSDKKIDFQYSFDPSLKFAFIYGNALNLERMLSNIIDNSVESFDEEIGVIKIGFSADKENIKITIQDAGKGMPPETVEKLMKGESVFTTKQGGFGIGTTQIRDTINELKGKQLIESSQNVGTKITLTIPKSDNPKWFLKKITLNKGDTVVILDDDVSIYSLFEKAFESYSNDISLKFFEQGQDAVDFINSFAERDRLILLIDYELRKQALDGLSVIKRSAISNTRAILVSSVYNRKEIQEKAESVGVKILPKSLLGDIKIVLDDV